MPDWPPPPEVLEQADRLRREMMAAITRGEGSKSEPVRRYREFVVRHGLVEGGGLADDEARRAS